MNAVRPPQGWEWEICRVYVDPALHGSGLSHALLDVAEQHALTAGADRLALWSDTRFDRAHRFYEKRSYVRHGPVRILNDISNSLEYRYAKPVDGIETFDIAAAESGVARLAAILITCVDDDASVGFLRPLEPNKAKKFWRRAASDVGAGTRVILGAWRGLVLVGAGTLDLATPETQPHRARVQMILVDPPACHGDLERQILQGLETAAIGQGRSLLTATVRADHPDAALYRGEGWQEAGCIPGFTQDAAGTVHAAAFFWKQIAG